MALHVTIEGAAGTVSEAVQQQAVTVGAPSVSVSFSAQELAVAVQSGGVNVSILAPGYSEELTGAQVLNDLEDVEASPVAGSLLEYDADAERWIAGHRLIFRPALKVYMISEPGG